MDDMIASQRKPSRPKTTARDRLIEVALRLFYQEGLRATGIDLIIAKAGVAKMSFYRHFPSKSHLIAECLSLRHENWMVWFKDAVEKRIAQTGGGIEVIAEVLRSWFEEPDFRGCPFINALAETAAAETRILEVIRLHKARVEVFLTDLATQMGYAAPRPMAAAVMVILDGCIVRAQMTDEAAIVCEACGATLRKFSRVVRKPEGLEIGGDRQLFLPL